jgi:hypothetical protein
MLQNSRVLVKSVGQCSLRHNLTRGNAGPTKVFSRSMAISTQKQKPKSDSAKRMNERRAMIEYEREIELIKANGGEGMSREELLSQAQVNLLQQYGNPSADAYAMTAFPTFPSKFHSFTYALVFTFCAGLSLPYSVKPTSWSKYSTWGSIFQQLLVNGRARIDSAISLVFLPFTKQDKLNVFPGYFKWLQQTPYQVLTCLVVQ